MTHMPRNRRGVGVVAALLVLVVLSTLGAAIARLGWTQHISFAQDVNGARAQRAANAGVEWGLYQALRPDAGGTWATCAGATRTLDMNADLGVRVTVTCNSVLYVEGQTGAGNSPTFTNRETRVYRIDAVACNGAGACPDNTQANSVGYIERSRQAQATGQ
jgi:MSHA biogenesis protein MshP